MSARATILTPRQIEVLHDLAYIRTEAKWSRKLDIGGVKTAGWAQPMEFGGTNGSHHSATATQLAKLGLVDRYKFGGWSFQYADASKHLNNFNCRQKGSCWYRITDAGLAAIGKGAAP